jgi:putative transcriptional regulator
MSEDDDTLNLTGKFLIAMPGMGDPRFDSSVIYMCDHSEKGAMGLIVNKPLRQGSFKELCRQLSIENNGNREVPILFGGPVETSRGFVLHSGDFNSEFSTQEVGDNLSLTSTRDIIEALAEGDAPINAGLFMGYAGWGAGQIESELMRNGWLVSNADEDLVLDTDHDGKWTAALGLLGINAMMLSSDAGRA